MFLVTSVIYSENIKTRKVVETWQEAITEYDELQDCINPKKKGWTRFAGSSLEVVHTNQFAFDAYNQGHICILKI